MRGPRRVGLGVMVILLAAQGSCSFDTTAEAPYVPPPTQNGVCGSTETLLPKLFAIIEDDGFAPLRTVLERRFLPTDANPNPQPSLRTIVQDLVRVVSQLGLDDTAYVVHIAASQEVETTLGPLVAALLKLIDGRIDGVPRYEAGDAVALFVRRCDPDHLLTAIERLLRFQSPSRGTPWIVAVLDELGQLVLEPELEPFLTMFEQNAERGRPAIVGLLGQVMGFVADNNFAISRVETLMESAVYPAVGPGLELRMRALIALLDEATRPEAGILVPLQGAVRCGNQHAAARNVLLGFLVDIVTAEELGLEALIAGIEVVSLDLISSELSLFAGAVAVVRDDLTVRDDLREVLAIMLGNPEAPLVVPVLIDLIERQVLAELLQAVVTLLDGCGRG